MTEQPQGPPGPEDSPESRADQGPQAPPPGQQPPPPPGQPPPQYGQPQPQYAPQPAGPPQAPGAVIALVLGIAGLVLSCWVLGPFAWWQGVKGERAADAAPGQYGGRGMATAGKILGIIQTVLLVLGVIVLIVVIILSIATESGGS